MQDIGGKGSKDKTITKMRYMGRVVRAVFEHMLHIDTDKEMIRK
jgi:hypothetical protein